MIALPQPTPEPENDGGIGGLCTGMKIIPDIRMTERAIRNRWPVSKSVRKLVVDTMAQIVGNSEGERERIAAARVLVSADAVNMKQAESEPKTVNHVHTGAVGVAMVDLRQELLANGGYLDTARSRASEADLHAGAVCQNGQPGQVENGSSPGATGPQTNGNH